MIIRLIRFYWGRHNWGEHCEANNAHFTYVKLITLLRHARRGRCERDISIRVNYA